VIIPTVKIKKILYTTDLSPAAQYAFAYATSLAQSCGAKLALLHVIEAEPKLDNKILGYISSAELENIRKDHEADARSVLVGKLSGGTIRNVLKRLGEDTRKELEKSDFQTDEVLVERGNPVEEILKQAQDKDFDLIVMGSHGQGTFERAMMGSTARRVLRRSKVPVLVVRLPDEANIDTESTISVIS
jgi:nucleotide-binding universal stress UspA family protein